MWRRLIRIMFYVVWCDVDSVRKHNISRICVYVALTKQMFTYTNSIYVEYCWLNLMYETRTSFWVVRVEDHFYLYIRHVYDTFNITECVLYIIERRNAAMSAFVRYDRLVWVINSKTFYFPYIKVYNTERSTKFLVDILI